MKLRTKIVLLAAGLAVAIPIGTVAVLSEAPVRILDPNRQCETGFSTLIDCNYHAASRTTVQGTPAFITPSSPPPAHPVGTILSAEQTSWAIVDCPKNGIARRLLCAAPPVDAPAQAASDDAVTGLPVPKPRVVKTAKNSPLIKSFHLETPLDLAAVLGFYRAELSKRGWTERDGAVVAPDRVVIAFTTADGPALLRLSRRQDRTIADLSLRKGADAKAGLMPRPGQVRLMLANVTDEEAVITINAQTIRLAARAGSDLADFADEGSKLPDSQKIDLPAGTYKFTLKMASGAAQNRKFEVAADETWGLVVGRDGTPFPLHIY